MPTNTWVKQLIRVKNIVKSIEILLFNRKGRSLLPPKVTYPNIARSLHRRAKIKQDTVMSLNDWGCGGLHPSLID